MPFLLPAAATAVAAAAPAAAASVASATVGATLTSIATNIAMNVAISAVMSALQPQVGAAGRTSEWTLSPDGPIPFAAGRIGVAGSAVHRATFGPDLMYLGVPSVISGSGPIDGYETFKADDEVVTFDGAGKAVSSQYAGELWFKRTFGNQPDVAVTSPTGLKNGSTLSGWGAQHKLSGKAAYMVVMGENSKGTAFPTGEIKPLIVVRGLKGWDPRLDSTYPGGAGPCRLHDPSTWVYLTNPILWGLKWALGLWEGPTLKGAPAHGSATDYQVGGIGAKLSGIDVAAFVACANISTAYNWTTCAYPTTDDDKFAVLESFLQAGGCVYASRAGKISCIQRAAPRTSIVTIGAADTAGPLEIDTAASRIDRINTIRPRITSEGHRWQLTAISEVTAQAYRDEDGGTRPRGIDYTYVSNATQAAQLAALQIANTREGIAGIIPLKPHLQKIKPGDAFTITEPGFVLNGLKCLCLSTDFDPTTKIVAVSFVSETDAKYPFALGQSQDPPVPPVLEPADPRYVSPPGETEWNIVVRPPSVGGGQVPGFDLTGAVDNATATGILVEWGSTAEGPWTQAYLGPPTVQSIPITGVQPGETYFIAVQNIRGQNYSARQIYGPYVAPSLVSDDTVNVGGVNSDLFVTRMIDVESLAAANAAAVGDLEDVYGDTVSAAASALAAEASATNAALSVVQAQGAADQAGDAADAAVISASIASTKATEASNSASAAAASQVAATSAFNNAVSLTRNPYFDQGLAGWVVTASAPAIIVPSAGGRSNLLQTPAGSTGSLYSTPVPIRAGGNDRISIGFRETTGTPDRYYAGLIFLDAAGNIVPGNDGTGNYPLVAGEHFTSANGWIDRSCLVGPNAPASPYNFGTVTFPVGATHYQLFFIYNYDGVAGVVTQVDYSISEEATGEVGARISAAAAATSASSASSSAGAAGASASAASGSATTASTQAGLASTYASQASTSASNASSSSVSAGTSATNAATSAATASTQASNASAAAASASSSAAIAASVGERSLTSNSGFDDYPVTPGIPAMWQDWFGTGNAYFTREPDGAGGYSARVDAPGGQDVGLYQVCAVGTVTPSSYYVIEAEATLNNGTFAGAGLFVDTLNAAANASIEGFPFALSTATDASGNLIGAGVVGRRYAWSRLVLTSANTAASRWRLMPASHFSSFGSTAVANSVIWHRAVIRPATAQEVAAGVALPALSASVTTLQTTTATLATNYALARYQVAAVTGGGAAVLALMSDTYGSVAGLTADQIYFGENTFFDNATDTMRTTIGTSVRVVAYGAPFGTDGQLTEWEGPAATAFAAMSRANAYFYRANAYPYFGGTAVAAAGTRITGLSSNIGRGYGAAQMAGTSSPFTVPATGSFFVEVSGSSYSDNDGDTSNANGSYRVYILKSGVETLLAGPFSCGASSTEGEPIAPYNSTVNHAFAGDIQFRVKTTGGGLATSSSGVFSGALKVTYTPA